MTEPLVVATVEAGDATAWVVQGDSRTVLAGLRGAARLVVTSPPYADARRGHYDGVHPDDYTGWFVAFADAIFQSLTPDGSFILNIKDKVVGGTRHRYVWQTVEALCGRGWFAIDDYLWHKKNPMPGRWPNRLSDGWEYCFHLARSTRPYFNPEAVARPVGDWAAPRLRNLGENDRTNWRSSNGSPFHRKVESWIGKETVTPDNVIHAAVVGRNVGHPAAFPEELPAFFIRLLTEPADLVVDPFGGSGTTALAALRAGRNCVTIDNNAEYCEVAAARLAGAFPQQRQEEVAI